MANSPAVMGDLKSSIPRLYKLLLCNICSKMDLGPKISWPAKEIRANQSYMIIYTLCCAFILSEFVKTKNIHKKLVLSPKTIQAKSKSKRYDKIYCSHIMESCTKISQVFWTHCMWRDGLVQWMGIVIFLSITNIKNVTNPHKQPSNEELTYLYCPPESQRYTSSVVICLSAFSEGL